tara:strand:- start:367 stop:771 length:405 start_codon:yes stop_codon:yes gene_type:complete
MNKEKQVWFLYKNHKEQLTLDCVDIIAKAFLELGVRNVTAQDYVALANILVEDLASTPKFAKFYIEDVQAAFHQGVRNNDDFTVSVKTYYKYLHQFEPKSKAKKEKLEHAKTQQLEWVERTKLIGEHIKKNSLK